MAVLNRGLLRAESVGGQLNGTIPSTSEGQTQDSSSLVDASGLTVSDMGSMGNAMGGGGLSNRGERFNRFDGQNDTLEAFNPFGGSAPPDMPNGNPTSSNAAPLLLGISTVILLTGIIAALLFQRRRPVRRK